MCGRRTCDVDHVLDQAALRAGVAVRQHAVLVVEVAQRGRGEVDAALDRAEVHVPLAVLEDAGVGARHAEAVAVRRVILEVQLLLGVEAEVLARERVLLVELVAHLAELRLDRAEALVKVGLDHVVVVRELLEVDRHLDHLDELAEVLVEVAQRRHKRALEQRRAGERIERRDQVRDAHHRLVAPHDVLERRGAPLEALADAQHVGHVLEVGVLQRVPRLDVLKEDFHQRLPVLDRGHADERLLEPLVQHARALRSLAVVQQAKHARVAVRRRRRARLLGEQAQRAQRRVVQTQVLGQVVRAQRKLAQIRLVGEQVQVGQQRRRRRERNLVLKLGRRGAGALDELAQVLLD